jgi:hypothetical protein
MTAAQVQALQAGQSVTYTDPVSNIASPGTVRYNAPPEFPDYLFIDLQSGGGVQFVLDQWSNGIPSLS